MWSRLEAEHAALLKGGHPARRYRRRMAKVPPGCLACVCRPVCPSANAVSFNHASPLGYPSSTTVSIMASKSAALPDVTICNLNAYPYYSIMRNATQSGNLSASRYWSKDLHEGRVQVACDGRDKHYADLSEQIRKMGVPDQGTETRRYCFGRRETVAQCMYKGKPCSMNSTTNQQPMASWATIADYDYCQCFTVSANELEPVRTDPMHVLTF